MLSTIWETNSFIGISEVLNILSWNSNEFKLTSLTLKLGFILSLCSLSASSINIVTVKVIRLLLRRQSEHLKVVVWCSWDKRQKWCQLWRLRNQEGQNACLTRLLVRTAPDCDWHQRLSRRTAKFLCWAQRAVPRGCSRNRPNLFPVIWFREQPSSPHSTDV